MELLRDALMFVLMMLGLVGWLIVGVLALIIAPFVIGTLLIGIGMFLIGAVICAPDIDGY